MWQLWLDGTVCVIVQAFYLQRTQVRNAVGGYAVVMKQIPLSLELYNAVVGGPSYYGLQDNALIGEGAIGIVTDSVAQ